MTTWTVKEIQAAIRLYAPREWDVLIEEDEDGVWSVQFLDAEEQVLFETSYPDHRLALLNAYGFVCRRYFVPSNPIWQRRRDDLRSATRTGFMHLPGTENIPDPEDLDPLSVYDPNHIRRPK